MTKEKLAEVSRINRLLLRETNKLIKLKNQFGINKDVFCEEDISMCEERIIELSTESARVKCEINKFICGIEDSLTRQIFYHRYVKCLPWQKISVILGGMIGSDGVRKVAERYLKEKS